MKRCVPLLAVGASLAIALSTNLIGSTKAYALETTVTQTVNINVNRSGSGSSFVCVEEDDNVG